MFNLTYDLLTKSKFWLVQKLWCKMQIFPFFVFFQFCIKTLILLYQLRFRLLFKHLKSISWTSKTWLEMIMKLPFISIFNFRSKYIMYILIIPNQMTWIIFDKKSTDIVELIWNVVKKVANSRMQLVKCTFHTKVQWWKAAKRIFHPHQANKKSAKGFWNWLCRVRSIFKSLWILPPVSEKSIWENQVQRTGFLVYFELDFYWLFSSLSN